jgi:hypothetical protein
MEKPMTKERILQQADGLRDLARRSRRLADTLSLESDRRRVQRHAVELEETANGLEKQAADARTGVFAPAVSRRAGDAG